VNKKEVFISEARFKRGLNLRWRPIRANYKGSISIEAFPISMAGKDYVAICAVNCDPRVTAYEYVTTDSKPVILYSNNISEPDFMDIYEAKKGYWPQLRLIDAEGNDIAPELRKLRDAAVRTMPSAGVGTAELFMIDVFCILLLLIGYIIARYYCILTE
jgi:hypothetical protein